VLPAVKDETETGTFRNTYFFAVERQREFSCGVQESSRQQKFKSSIDSRIQELIKAGPGGFSCGVQESSREPKFKS
jgi:hypothetical protein